jgi:hypothetical protein
VAGIYERERLEVAGSQGGSHQVKVIFGKQKADGRGGEDGKRLKLGRRSNTALPKKGVKNHVKKPLNFPIFP